jgi:succinate-semialdehyde dehydrogenase/glutarate-semialdehyde dehydrogenase
MQHQAEIMDVIIWETGKARKHAYDEPLHIALTARYYGQRTKKIMGTHKAIGAVPGLTQVEINHVPKGVVGIIAPWNYPFSLALCDGIAAIAAGNAVVIKPDSQTVLTALIGARLLEEAGFPKDLWQTVAGAGSKLGPEIDQPLRLHLLHRLDRTGKIIAKGCADRLIGCSLELGGKNPILVLRDADINRAVEGAVRATFSNAGQLVCLHRADVRRRCDL